jgi:hypothetical protein
MKRIKEVALVVFMIAIVGIPRLVGLGKFITVDEPFWIRQGANFYYALGQREFKNTLYEYHPAVTTMWAVTGGMLAYYPEYRALQQGYLKPGKFNSFLPEHGKDPLQLLIASRAVQVVIDIILFLVVYFLLRLLFDGRSAFFITALISLSPFFLGHSRVLNHEGMLGLFLLASLLSMLVFLYIDRKLSFLLLSSITAALAQLTKSSGILLFPVIVLVLLVHAAGFKDRKFSQSVVSAVKTFGIWLVFLIISYFLFWPGMWVAPGEMLYDVYGNALSYSFQGTRLSAVTQLDPSRFLLGDLSALLRLYLSDIVWRTTPVSWLGFILGVWFAVTHKKSGVGKIYQLTILYSVIFAASVILMFSALRAPYAQHYILTSYVLIDLVAGLGLVHAVSILAERLPKLASQWATGLALGVLVLVQLISALRFYPYYISYYNPIMNALHALDNPDVNGLGYGVGLDQAAAYLSQKPGASEMMVLSVHGYGCFSYYFPGKTTTINELTLDDIDMETLETLRDSQYVVIDYHYQSTSNLMGGLEGIEPEKIIWINRLPYLYIYRTADLLARVDQISH